MGTAMKDDWEVNKPPHYNHKKQDVFGRTQYFNPPEWGSHKAPTLKTLVRALQRTQFSTQSASEDRTPAVRKPDFSATSGLSEKDQLGGSGVRSWWLGHASTYTLLPFNGGSIGILSDPALSKRCSPSQWIGPKRKRDPPCKISDLPTVDVVLISHDHYDHCDESSIRDLVSYHPEARYVVGEGVQKTLTKWGVASDKVFSRDWWDRIRFRGSQLHEVTEDELRHQARSSKEEDEQSEVEKGVIIDDLGFDDVPSLLFDSPHPTGIGQRFDEISFAEPIEIVLSGYDKADDDDRGPDEDELIITVCPSQHNSGRGMFSKNSTLWVSHYIELRRSEQSSYRIFYAGDTGYRSSPSGPASPVFGDIRTHLGSPDLSFLPIAPGSVLPYIKELLRLPLDEELLTRHIHMTPSDAVEVHQTLGSRRTVGVHWGTWATRQGGTCTVNSLEKAREENGVPSLNDRQAGGIGVVGIGQLIEC